MLEAVLNPTPTRKRGSRAGRDTREEILNAAEELLQRRGYNAFSYQHIAVQLGIRNAAIHYHFPAKEDLGVALVRRYRDRFREWCEQTNRLDNAWDRLSAYFQTYVDFLDDQCKICPAGVLGSEYEAIPEEMRQEARLLMREIFEWLVETLDHGRAHGTLQFPGDSRHKAVEIGAALQGGLQIARMAGQERFHQVLAQLGLELAQPSANPMP
ncbi:MAG TPA: TetR/AcrR family transcriptional regulator [Nevskiaceae bacterium]|nr:TetR/AcrR family transcriptional regulator [Nevskiaceae bacterium]